jgi:hypothetical protein
VATLSRATSRVIGPLPSSRQRLTVPPLADEREQLAVVGCDGEVTDAADLVGRESGRCDPPSAKLRSSI